MKWQVLLSRQAVKDIDLLRPAALLSKAQELLAVLEVDPFQNPPAYEKLRGDLAAKYSRRINRQHRLVYEVDLKAHTVRVLRMWSHYG